MFCGQCGTENLNDAAFCKRCGARLDNTAPTAPEDSQIPRTEHTEEKRNRIIKYVIVAVIVIIAISLFGGRSYKSLVRGYVNASFEADGEVMLSLIPSKVLALGCEEDEITWNEAADYLTEELEYMLDDYDSYFDDWRYSYKITEVEDYSNKELKYLKEDYKYEFDITIKGAKTVTVELTITADDKTESDYLELPIVKIGNSWYLDLFSAGSISWLLPWI